MDSPPSQCSNLTTLHSIYLRAETIMRAHSRLFPCCIVCRSPFTSAHKAVMESPPNQRCELISFHSVSKGTSGECGLRGGYHVFTNIHPDTVAQFYKLSSIGLCPNTIGQVSCCCC